MTDYEAEQKKIMAEQAKIESQMDSLRSALKKNMERIQELEEERIKNSRTEFSPEEEKWFRDEMTVVGKILCSPDVVFGKLEYLNEEPDEMHTRGYFNTPHSKKFSIDVKLSICTEFRACLDCEVVVKSKFSNVEEMLRDMFEATGYATDEENRFRTCWNIDWDYHDHIRLKNPYVHPDDKKK